MYHLNLFVDQLLEKVIDRLREIGHVIFPDFKQVLSDLFSESYEAILKQSTLHICEEENILPPTQSTGIVPWIGGKCKHLKWLLPMIPYAASYKDYQHGECLT